MWQDKQELFHEFVQKDDFSGPKNFVRGNNGENITFSSIPVEFLKSSKQIIDTNFVKSIESLMGELWLRKGNDFPGNLCVSLMKKDMKLLKTKKYNILLKSDGTRMMLFIFCRENEFGKKQYLVDFIDRSFSHKIVNCKVKPELFSGCLFDGEMIYHGSEGVYEYQIFDCILYCGNDISELQHPQRLEFARKCLPLIKTEESIFYITVKDYVELVPALKLMSQIEEYERKKLNNTNNNNIENDDKMMIDGLILIDPTNPYRSGKDNRLFKYKVGLQHTCDFLIVVSEDKKNIHLCVLSISLGNTGKITSVYNNNNNNNDMEKKSNMKKFISKEILPWDSKLKTFFKCESPESIHGTIVECRWDSHIGKWKPINIRYDKTVPNNLVTFERTSINIQENILPKDLYHLLNEII